MPEDAENGTCWVRGGERPTKDVAELTRGRCGCSDERTLPASETRGRVMAFADPGGLPATLERGPFADTPPQGLTAGSMSAENLR